MIKLASKWFIPTQITQNLEFINLTHVSYRQPIWVSLKSLHTLFDMYTAQPKFPNSTLKDPNLKTHHPLGETGGWLKMNNLFLHILTPRALKSNDKCQRYGHFSASQKVFKMTPSIGWIYTLCSQYWVCAFYDCQIKSTACNVIDCGDQ